MRTGETADGGGAELHGKPVLHVDEGISDFIGRDITGNADAGHIRGNKGIGHAHGVSLDAGYFNGTGDGVADKAQQILHAHAPREK